MNKTWTWEVTGWKAGLIVGLAIFGIIEAIIQLISIVMLPWMLPQLLHICK